MIDGCAVFLRGRKAQRGRISWGLNLQVRFVCPMGFLSWDEPFGIAGRKEHAALGMCARLVLGGMECVPFVPGFKVFRLEFWYIMCLTND